MLYSYNKVGERKFFSNRHKSPETFPVYLLEKSMYKFVDHAVQTFCSGVTYQYSVLST